MPRIHCMDIDEFKKYFAEKSALIKATVDKSASDDFPKYYLTLSQTYFIRSDAALTISGNPSGYALQFSEDVGYVGKNKSFMKLSSGEPVYFTSWKALKDFILELPNEDREIDLLDYIIIKPDGSIEDRNEDKSISLEDLFRRTSHSDDEYKPPDEPDETEEPTPAIEEVVDMDQINLPDSSTSYPSEQTLRQKLGNEIRGQTLAINTVSHQIVAHFGKKNPKRPLSFVFYGKPGTGKTEAAKVLASIMHSFCDPKYDSSVTQLNTFDEKHSVSRLIGSPPGYVGYDDECVFDAVVKNKYMVFIFDEVEKAHPENLKAFMSILDEGKLASRKELSDKSFEFDFRHCIFIFTSNLNLSSDQPRIGFGSENDVKEIKVTKKGADISYIEKCEEPVEDLNQQIYTNTEKARNLFMHSGVLAEIASRFNCFVEFQPLSEMAKLEILVKMILHAGFEYGVRLSKIDNGIMQELVNASSSEAGLTVRSYRAIIEGYLGNVFAQKGGTNGPENGCYRLGGTLSRPLLLPAKTAEKSRKSRA